MRRWSRLVGDTLLTMGVIVLGWFILGLRTGHSYADRGYVIAGESEIREELPVGD